MAWRRRIAGQRYEATRKKNRNAPGANLRFTHDVRESGLLLASVEVESANCAMLEPKLDGLESLLTRKKRETGNQVAKAKNNLGLLKCRLRRRGIGERRRQYQSRSREDWGGNRLRRSRSAEAKVGMDESEAPGEGLVASG